MRNHSRYIFTGCTAEEFNSLSFTRCQGRYGRLVKVCSNAKIIAVRIGEECSLMSTERMSYSEVKELFLALLK